MSVEVVMSQMGESITEGTVSRWFKQIGEKVEKDEPILEISTDKVDAEVFAPSAGVLLEILTNEGETVEVGTAIGILGEEGETAAEVKSPKPQVQSQAQTTQVEESKAEESEQSETVEQTQTASANSANSGNSTEVVMPQMGESITEGTVSKWMKAVGDKIEKDETLLEISTDKVDAEVPSPVAGTLLEIRTNEGETVEVGAVVGLVGAEGAASTPNSASNASSQTSAAGQAQAEQQTAQATSAVASVQTSVSMPAKERVEIEESEGRSYDYQRPEAIEDAQTNGKSNGKMSLEDLRRTKSSPLVRNIAKEHGVDISRIEGSGMSGRVTKKDILSFIETGAALRPQDLLRKDAPDCSAKRSANSSAARTKSGVFGDDNNAVRRGQG